MKKTNLITSFFAVIALTSATAFANDLTNSDTPSIAASHAESSIVKEISEPFRLAPNRWACYAVHSGGGMGAYYVGAPSNSKSFVSWGALNRCKNLNQGNNPSQCYLKECRFGQY